MIIPTISEWTQIGTLALLALAYMQSRKNGKTINEVKHQTNSMKDELVAEVKAASHAEGVKEQKEKTIADINASSP